MDTGIAMALDTLMDMHIEPIIGRTMVMHMLTLVLLEVVTMSLVFEMATLSTLTVMQMAVTGMIMLTLTVKATPTATGSRNRSH